MIGENTAEKMMIGKRIRALDEEE